MSTEYDRKFQEYLTIHASKSAEKVMELVCSWFSPESIVDFGCGTGDFLAKGKEIMRRNGLGGVILGLDGNYVERDLLKIDPDKEFKPVDLTTNIRLDRKFDVAMSLEVGEHLEEQCADTFVDNIVSAADIVLFSAALPGQFGVHHVNERYISYWVEKFEKRGYEVWDVVRPIIWWDKDIDLDYRQNSVIFIKKGNEASKRLEGLETKIMDIAHPEFLEGRTKAWRYWQDKVDHINNAHPVLRKLLKRVWGRYKNR